MRLRQRLIIAIGGAIVLHFVLFGTFGVLGQFQMLPPDWVADVVFPGWALFWPHGIHSDSLLVGFAAGGVVNVCVYALLIQATVWAFGGLHRRTREAGREES